MTHDSSSGDVEIAVLWPEVEALLDEHPEVLAFLKWTCPCCGERVLSNTPNCYETGGYIHEERADGQPCGSTYAGTRFGLALVALLREAASGFTIAPG